MSSARSKAIEYIPNRLYYITSQSVPSDTSTEHYFSTDNVLVYWNFFLDFGPLNLGQTYRFCSFLNQKLNEPSLRNKKIYYYSSSVSTISHTHSLSLTPLVKCVGGGRERQFPKSKNSTDSHSHPFVS